MTVHLRGGATGQSPCLIDCNGDEHEEFSTAAYLDACDICVGGLTGLSHASETVQGPGRHLLKMHVVCAMTTLPTTISSTRMERPACRLRRGTLRRGDGCMWCVR